MLKNLSPNNRNWLQLVLLLVVSGLTELSFSYLFSLPHFPWIMAALGTTTTALVFIFSFEDRILRNAALAGLGIAALLMGPFLVSICLVDFPAQLHSSEALRAYSPHFHLATLLIGLVGSALLWSWEKEQAQAENSHRLRNTALAGLGLIAWLTGFFLFLISPLFFSVVLHWVLLIVSFFFVLGQFWILRKELFPAKPKLFPQLQPFSRRFLFYILIYLVLIIPSCSTQNMVHSIKNLTDLPARRALLPSDQTAFAQAMQKNFVLTLERSLAGIAGQSIGLFSLISTLFLISHATRATLRSPGGAAPEMFPQAKDILLLCSWGVSGLLFSYFCPALAHLDQQFIQSSAQTEESWLKNEIHADNLFLVFLPGFTFALSGFFLARRFYQATQLHGLFVGWFLVVSLGLSELALAQASAGFAWLGYTALFAFLVQGVLFSLKRRAWVFPPWTNSGKTALQIALQGTIALGLLGNGFWSMAINMALVSVADISYLISYGTALQKNLPAPVGEIGHLYAPLLINNALFTGPVFFIACLFLSAAASLILSLLYLGSQALFSYLKLTSTSSLPCTTPESGRLIS